MELLSEFCRQRHLSIVLKAFATNQTLVLCYHETSGGALLCYHETSRRT